MEALMRRKGKVSSKAYGADHTFYIPDRVQPLATFMIGADDIFVIFHRIHSSTAQHLFETI